MPRSFDLAPRETQDTRLGALARRGRANMYLCGLHEEQQEPSGQLSPVPSTHRWVTGSQSHPDVTLRGAKDLHAF